MKLLLGLLLLTAPVLAQDFEALVTATTPKVVAIAVKGIVEMPISLSLNTSTRTVVYGGSGALISADGFVLTCHHLFDPPMKDMVITVKTSDGKQLRGFLIGEDKVHDLALLKVFPRVKNLPHFVFGVQPKAGQRVLAIGSPLGIDKTTTIGFVSNAKAKHRGDTAVFTMHTASINPGNSGGPLVSTKGELIGVNVATYLKDMFQTAEGMHLAVRMEDIQKFLGGK